MDAIDFLHMQLRLEGKSLVGEDSLRQVEFVPGEEMPLMVIASLSSQDLVAYYDEALSPEIHKEIDRQVHALKFPHIDPILDTLQSRGLKVEIGHYKTYLFPKHYKDLEIDDVKRYSKSDSRIQAFGFDEFTEQVYAIERDGKIVSACVSARENDHCGEAWVCTDEKYRHQGFAQKVVGAWAGSLIAAGKVPFYSHQIQNNASASLAKRLGLQSVFEEIVISRMDN